MAQLDVSPSPRGLLYGQLTRAAGDNATSAAEDVTDLAGDGGMAAGHGRRRSVVGARSVTSGNGLIVRLGAVLSLSSTVHPPTSMVNPPH